MMPSQESAKVFLTELFATLKQMVDNSMDKNSEHQDNLQQTKTNLQLVKSDFTSSPILDEVEGKLEAYKKKVQKLLDGQPEVGDLKAVKKTMEK